MKAAKMSRIKMILDEENPIDCNTYLCERRRALRLLQAEIHSLQESIFELEKNRPRDPKDPHYADELFVSGVYREALEQLIEQEQQMQELYDDI